MLPVLYYSREYQHLPMKERHKAAQEARQRVMSHWQFWVAIGIVIIATVGGSLIADHWFGGNPGTTVGALCGFLIGMGWYGRTLYRIGMPYYRQILSEYEKKAGQP